MLTAILAYVSLHNTLGLEDLGQTRRDFACTVHKIKKSNEEWRTFHCPCLCQRIQRFPYVDARGALVLRMERWDLRRSIAGMG